MLFICGLCLGIFFGCAWTMLAAYTDWKRNEKRLKEEAFYSLEEVIFSDDSSENVKEEIVLPEV